MTNTLLWIIVIELTLGLVLGGYVLYEIQTALAVIVLGECTDTPPKPESLVHIPEVMEAEAPRASDDRDTIGTFTGAAWH